MPTISVEGYPEVVVAEGLSLLEACEEGGIPMDSACGGFACCNSCRVDVIAGELSPKVDEEIPFLDAEGQRLGCQAFVVGDVAVRLAPGA
jgi:ferredoxin